ncbi:MAG: DUF4333 domain-containing protein [Patulibacter minatonensis]
MLHVRSLVPTLALPAIVALAACGTGAVPADELERTVSDKLLEKVKVKPKKVDCPESGLEAKVGAKATCVLTAPNGDQVDVLVTAKKVEGSNVSFDFEVGQKVKKAAG